MKNNNNPHFDGEDVTELGPRRPDQESLSDLMLKRISHGHMMKSYDEIEKKRHLINHIKTSPNKVDANIFDVEVTRFSTFSEGDFKKFDDELLTARGETRAEGGVYVDRISFGPDVFGFAYHLPAGKWTMTNEHGLHSYCTEELTIEFHCPLTHVLSGFIFQTSLFETPVMTPYGYPYADIDLIKKALEDIWSWKRFMLVVDLPEKNPCYNTLFTPEHAEKWLREFQSRM